MDFSKFFNFYIFQTVFFSIHEIRHILLRASNLFLMQACWIHSRCSHDFLLFIRKPCLRNLSRVEKISWDSCASIDTIAGGRECIFRNIYPSTIFHPPPISRHRRASMESHFSRPGPRSNRLMGTSVTRPRFVALPCTNERQELRDPRDRNGVGLERLWQKLLKPRSFDVQAASSLLLCFAALDLSLSLSLSLCSHSSTSYRNSWRSDDISLV